MGKESLPVENQHPKHYYANTLETHSPCTERTDREYVQDQGTQNDSCPKRTDLRYLQT